MTQNAIHKIVYCSIEKLVIWQLCCDGGLFHFGNSLAYQNAFLP